MNDNTAKSTIIKESLRLYENGRNVVNIQKAIPILYDYCPKNSDKVIESAIDMYISYCNTVDAAGGSLPSLDEILDTTMMDMISHLSTNNVRFIYCVPKPDKALKVDNG